MAMRICLTGQSDFVNLLVFAVLGESQLASVGASFEKRSRVYKRIMMEIKPFKAVRFDAKHVGDVSACVSPPYDVINDKQQNQLYEKSDYNIVRIILGKKEASDDEDNNQYTRAAGYLKKWLAEGALKQDSQEAIYGYVQDFQAGGKAYRRFSFIALAKLEQFGDIVRPHEKTMDAPIVDRLNLNRATGAKFGLVFMLYEDKKQVAETVIEKAMKQQPQIDFTDEQGVRHQLFSITGEEDTKAIAEMMQDKKCVIADGHHRYTTALKYKQENDNPAAAFQMLAFSNTAHEGLVVLATHRLVDNLPDFDFEKFLGELKSDFEITEFHFDSEKDKADAKEKMLLQMKKEHRQGRNGFGIYGGNGNFYVAALKDRSAMDSVAAQMSEAWLSLDVSVLHKLILEKLLKIGEKELASKSNLEYVKDTQGAVDYSIAKVDSGEKQAAFFTNPERIEQIHKVADAGEVMPQKSTYFYPKVFTGLTINKL